MGAWTFREMYINKKINYRKTLAIFLHPYFGSKPDPFFFYKRFKIIQTSGSGLESLNLLKRTLSCTDQFFYFLILSENIEKPDRCAWDRLSIDISFGISAFSCIIKAAGTVNESFERSYLD